MGGILIEGRGRSVKISSSGILIATEAALPLGALIEIVIAWPAKLDDGACLNLHVRGRTLRSYGNHTAVAIIRYEFRTRASAVTSNPAIHDRYLSRKNGVVVARVPEGTDGVVPRPASRRLGFVSSRFLRGRAPVRLSGAYL
jgi:hypothetical protein